MERYLSPGKAQTPRNIGNCAGFDEFAGQRWIYPNNMTVRGYQKAAVELALFNNAMIVLPTGFGKTFIAAVVMYNFYHWYPQGKVIFVAPTKPLVNQQIAECKKITGIPKADILEATGLLGVEKRRLLWNEKRVIFATPQVIENDLANRILPVESIRCIVIDEAHRAQGGYAYVNIVRYLHDNNRDGFRVLALSATPGSDIQRVQQVMQNLFINEVLFRSETSIDLMQYRNEKNSKAWTVELVGKHKSFVDRFIAITKPIFKDLYKAGLTYSGDSIEKVAKYTLFKAMQSANNNEIARTGARPGRIKYLCCAAVALSQKFELLTLYGIRVFYSSLKRTMNEPKSAIKTIMTGQVELDKMLLEMEAIFGDDIDPDPEKKAKTDLLQGHPKLVAVKDLLMNHFRQNEGRQETRAIVFTKYRESVFDIVQSLRAYEPLIKPAPFVGQGQGQASKTGIGMSQKEQIAHIRKFKDGEFNVLVATCVAEEGLDIGEVDLIICYDTSSSPISTTQRRGRTGRKRSGNVQTICTKGYEEKKLQRAGASRRQVEDQLFRKENYTHVKYHQAPRMVPAHIHPVCMEHKIFVVDDEVEETPKQKKGRKSKKNSETNTTGGFISAKKLASKDKKIDDSDDEHQVSSVKKKRKKITTCEDDSEDEVDIFAKSNEEPLTSETLENGFREQGQESTSNDAELTIVESSTPKLSNNSIHEVTIEDDGDEEWDDQWELPPDFEKVEKQLIGETSLSATQK